MLKFRAVIPLPGERLGEGLLNLTFISAFSFNHPPLTPPSREEDCPAEATLKLNHRFQTLLARSILGRSLLDGLKIPRKKPEYIFLNLFQDLKAFRFLTAFEMTMVGINLNLEYVVNCVVPAQAGIQSIEDYFFHPLLTSPCEGEESSSNPTCYFSMPLVRILGWISDTSRYSNILILKKRGLV